MATNQELISIGEAAKMLNISIDTLRRWDKEGHLKSTRISKTGHRYYNLRELELLNIDLFKVAKEWVTNNVSYEPDNKFYCPDSATFQARLNKLEGLLSKISGFESEFSLVTSIVGEIGNNSFDHNVGSWSDIRGILFAYNLNKRQIVLADRGQGIFTTLKRVRPELTTDKDALALAFTEKVSGRAPESRGNGLKYVKRVITQETNTISIKLFFQTGSAELDLEKGDESLNIIQSKKPFRGCLALITF